MSLPAKNLVYQPAPCCRWNIIFNISRVSLREFRPLINFEPLCIPVLNANCQASAIAREKLSRIVAMSISAKTNRNPAIYPSMRRLFSEIAHRDELFETNSVTPLREIVNIFYGPTNWS